MAGYDSGSRKKGRYTYLMLSTPITNDIDTCSPTVGSYNALQHSQTIHNLPVIPTTPQLTALLAAGELGVITLSDLLKT